MTLDPFNIPAMKTTADRDSALADIAARLSRRDITPKQAKHERSFVNTAFESYQTAAAKSRFMAGRSCA